MGLEEPWSRVRVLLLLAIGGPRPECGLWMDSGVVGCNRERSIYLPDLWNDAVSDGCPTEEDDGAAFENKETSETRRSANGFLTGERERDLTNLGNQLHLPPFVTTRHATTALHSSWD